MPELPEVETVRRGLNANILKKKIVKIEILKPKLVKHDPAKFREILIGSFFQNIQRIGKLLIFELNSPPDKVEREGVLNPAKKFLLIHLKMTGQLIWQKGAQKIMGGHFEPHQKNEFPNKYSHIIFDFEDGGQLFYNDLRQFGYLKIVEGKELAEIRGKYGIEPGTENYTWENFRGILVKRHRMILKSFLLNQQIIAGLGNIYVDEACFRSRILPERKVGSLSDKEAKLLFRNIREIIAEAIEMGGTTFRNYRDALGGKGNFTDKLQVYGLEKTPCQICGTPIEKIKLAGRGTHFCPKCQR
jgi:formamidopyrimidine-DNA glycosylase